MAPENFDNSRINSITSEQLTIKTDDLIKQKEVLKYIQDKEKLLSLIKTYCEFLKISEDKETLEYVIPDNLNVFNILNIPLKMNKEEVKKNIELINLQYNRLYKRGFYWVLSTVEKETVICMQNSLRDLTFEESKVKYDLSNRNQIFRSMREQVEKSSYQKEAKNLGISSGSGSGSKNFGKKKGSDADMDAFSWRKGSCEGKTSFDVNEKNYKKNSYYNNKNNQKKRSRFNSDNQGLQYNNYHENNNYNYSNYNNHKNSYYNNNNYRNNNNNKDIEIDISNLKYPMHIKHKYSFDDIKAFYKKICDNNVFLEKPKYLSDICNEIISDKKKEVIVLDELIESSKKLTQINNSSEIKEKNNKINTNLKIPKMNPLSKMGKGFGSQKAVNSSEYPSTVEENTKEE